MTTETSRIAGSYAADPIHSSFGFAVKYLGSSTFRGTFDSVTATLEVGPDTTVLSGAAAVESISIRTPEQFRAHVLGDEFFAAATHPEITCESDSVVLDGDGTATVDGRLTIRGVAQPVTARGTWAPAQPDPTGRIRSHLALEAAVNRRDYGFDWNVPMPSGDGALADDVAITVELALVAKD
jgi:polyisoprenoid-binding protein YceI